MEGQGGLVILIPSISFGSTIGRVWPKLNRTDFRYLHFFVSLSCHLNKCLVAKIRSKMNHVYIIFQMIPHLHFSTSKLVYRTITSVRQG